MPENQFSTSDILKIPKVNVSQATFDTLLGKVMDGTWKQGEKIPSENELKEMLGVSRHTVRSAITNLNMLGILETRRGDGNYVKGTGVALYIDFLIPYLFTGKTDVAKILEFRESIESTAARYAAMRATANDLCLIEEKMHICEQNNHDLQNYPAFDFDFHLAIAEASKSDLLIQSMYVVKKYCFAAIAEYFDLDLTLDGTDLHHRRIYEALIGRDADRACEAMGKHIRSIIHKIDERSRLG
ncbi:FadR/GntR family transcriptional regulator [Marasmitruncus massiliensis]|uniref:FadR/GntR family transcriptional regulator n=1 Tax=Marasmitruncus massiliensis TaxID=1944642 RepID=UPI000C7C4483|nr:FadR/GntR family transcriptional regulator [Marasmitruncus massiliensis]